MPMSRRPLFALAALAGFTAVSAAACSGGSSGQRGQVPTALVGPSAMNAPTFAPLSDPANTAVVCHTEGNGGVAPLAVSPSALGAHLEHGDGQPGGAVPGMPGFIYNSSCAPVPVANLLTCPCWDTYSQESLVAHLQQFTIEACGGGPFDSAILTSGDDLVVRAIVGGSFCGGPGDRFVGGLTSTQVTACSTELRNVAVALGCAQ